ncbi:MAG: DUF2510 domain-containing protein [Actinomycetota bacterium]|nr:DUF2510 domain-containing protein [Actinomycetota bacterium]
MSAPAGWYPDPTRRHGERYWAGAHWTEHVRDRGTAGVDPLEVAVEQSHDDVRTGYQGYHHDTHRATAAPQGWYPSPGVAGEERYWDGTRWTNYTRPTRATQTQEQPGGAREAKTNGKAVASLTLALVWLGGIASIPAIVLGLLAKREIRRSSEGERGLGLASAGIVVGVLGLLLAGLMFATFVVIVLLVRQ